MFNRTRPAPSPGAGRKWLPLALVGGLAVVAGVVLPQMLGGVALPESPPAATAEQKDSLEYAEPKWPEPPDSRAMLTRLCVGTVVVLVLCVAMLVVCRRWLRQVPGQGAANTRLALVETLPLGNRCLVHLVRVGKQQVLVGVDGGGLKSLVALPDAFDDALAEAQDAPAPAAEEAPAIPRGPALAALVGPTKPATW
jgi:flagellar biogenesis protein FliO